MFLDTGGCSPLEWLIGHGSKLSFVICKMMCWFSFSSGDVSLEHHTTNGRYCFGIVSVYFRGYVAQSAPQNLLCLAIWDRSRLTTTVSYDVFITGGFVSSVYSRTCFLLLPSSHPGDTQLFKPLLLAPHPLTLSQSSTNLGFVSRSHIHGVFSLSAVVIASHVRSPRANNWTFFPCTDQR